MTLTILLVNLAMAGIAIIVLDGVNEFVAQLRRDDDPGDGGGGGGGWWWRRRPRAPRDDLRPTRGGPRSPARTARARRPRARR